MPTPKTPRTTDVSNSKTVRWQKKPTDLPTPFRPKNCLTRHADMSRQDIKRQIPTCSEPALG
jgi:hypothetical protein